MSSMHVIVCFLGQYSHEESFLMIGGIKVSYSSVSRLSELSEQRRFKICQKSSCVKNWHSQVYTKN